jgi:hypothetical protein
MEVWKNVLDYEGIYQVSNLGNVKSLSRKLNNQWGDFISKEKILKNCKNSNGYLFVKLCKNNIEKAKSVHRLVAIAFLGYSDLVVNHKDSNKLNNCIDNLEFCTVRQNVHHYENTQKRYSKLIGVSFDKTRNKFTSKIKVKKKTINLGRFLTEEEAFLAYCNYKLKNKLC